MTILNLVKPPLFSIITACYNDGEKLKKTITSVFLADTPEKLVEYVVADGGSNEETIRILEEMAEKHHQFRYISEADSGLYDALNKALKLAQGQYVIVLGAGDTLRQGILEKLAKALDSYAESNSSKPLPDLLYGNPWYQKTGAIRGGGIYSKERLFQFNLCHQAMVVQRESAIRSGGFDLSFPIAADLAHTYKLFGLRDFTSLYVPEIIADFEQDGIGDATPDPTWFQTVSDLIGANLGQEAEKNYKRSGRRFDDFLRHSPNVSVLLLGRAEDSEIVRGYLEQRCASIGVQAKIHDDTSMIPSSIVVFCDSSATLNPQEQLGKDLETATEVIHWPGYIFDQNLMQNLKQHQGPFVLFGAGWMCESLIFTLRQKGWGDLIAGVLDNFAESEQLLDVPLYKPDSPEGQHLLKTCGRVIISNGWPQMMRDQLKELGVPENKVLSLWGT